MSTRRHATTLVVVTLAGTLALGACGAQRTTSDGVVKEEAQNVQAEDAEARSRAAAARLHELRAKYPTAGTEVPPADLFATETPAGPGSPDRNHRTLRHAE